MLKKALSCIGFLLVFAVSFYFVDAVMKFKYEDGIQTLDHYYDLPPSTVDVLLAGSSHMGVNMDPSILWDEYGIAAYNLWGSVQPVWNSYYYIKEGLKYQTPRVVALDAHMLSNDLEYGDYSNMVKNTIAMRPSEDRLNAVSASVTDDLFSDLLLGWPTYHARYEEIGQQDFSDFFWNKYTDIQNNEEIVAENTGAMTPIDSSLVEERLPLPPKQEEYFRKIIDLCRERGVELCLVASPYQVTEEEQMRFNTVTDICEAEGVPFINYNQDFFYKEAGIDSEVDFGDPGHLNVEGVVKYTTHLGGILKSRYGLTDRREDAGHIWQRQSGEMDDGLIYRLPERFVGNGRNRYVDTGVKLYDNPLGSWTLKAEIDTTAGDGGDMVYFSCFSEDPSDYRGLMVRRAGDEILVVASDIYGYAVRDFGETLSLAIVKELDSYTLYVDGVAVYEGMKNRYDGFDGNLLIGCQEDFDGKKFRYSETTTLSLEVYGLALNKSRAIEPLERAPEITDDMPSGLTDPENLLYRLPVRYDGDPRQEAVDTGVPLYDEADKSYSLLAEISPETEGNDRVYLSCFSEEEGNYRGLLARKNEDGTLSVICGENWEVHEELPETGASRLAVVKDGSVYTIYLNGEVLADEITLEADPFDGNLLVGAQQLPDGRIIRKSKTAVSALEVYSGALSRADVQNWAPELPPVPAYPEADKPVFAMESPFLGDGVSRYLDTGIALYDDPEKPWTLSMDITRNRGMGWGAEVYVSCFNEKYGDYHGLLVRQKGEEGLEIIAGRVSSAIALPELADEFNLTIVKNKSSYDFYLDGAAVLTGVESESPVHNGSLLIGCQEDAGGGMFRFGRVEITALQLADSLWTQAQIESFMENEDERPGRGW